MQSSTPTSRYLKAINEGTHQPDDVQREAVNRLENIYQALTANTSAVPEAKGFMARVGKLLGKKKRYTARRCEAYICGGRRARKNLADGSVLP